MVIVSNKLRTDQRLARNRDTRLFAIALILLAVATLVLFMGQFALMIIPLLIFAVIIVAPMLRHKPYFECYVTDDRLLHFRFRIQKEQRRYMDEDAGTGPDGEKQMAVHLDTVWGYESHSFFTKEQQIICLLLHTTQGIIRTTPILVEHLNEQEKGILFSWLDRVIAHNKQTAIAGDQYRPELLN